MGEPNANGRGKALNSKPTQFGSPERAARLKQLSAESQGLLEGMRHVSTNPPSADTTYQQKHCRRWLCKDVVGFMRTLANLERQAERKAARVQKPPAQAEAEQPLDRILRERPERQKHQRHLGVLTEEL